MWTIESVRRDCQGDCGSPRKLQMRTGIRISSGERQAELQQGDRSDLAFTNRQGVWLESSGRKADYGNAEPASPVNEEDVPDGVIQRAV